MKFTMARSAAALFDFARCAITAVSILASSASTAFADAPLPNHPETGAVPGQAGTDGGAATYTIPIEVPPGRAGMQPSLSFNYNSRAGDGVMGLGWSIGGLSAIHRCPQTPEQDNRTRGVSYSTGANGDRLCLDGQRLVPSPSSTDYGTLGMTYATEIDSHARITQAGGDLSAAATCFKVEERSGRILHYGAVVTGSSCSSSGSARVQPNGAAAPLSWLLVKVEDRAGNSEAYAYDSSAGYGEVLLQSVIYTTGIIAGDRKVLFNYEPRTSASSSASDIGSSALDGGMSMQTKALLSVATSVNNATARTYTPVYAAATYSHRLLMTGIQECAGSGSQGACHTTTQFGYNDGALDFQFTSLAALGLPTPVQGGVETFQFSMVGDLNGDGAREAAATVHQSDGNHFYMLQLTPDRHVQSKIDLTGTNFQLSPTLTADIDGSGRSSLVDLPLSTGNITFGLWNFAAFPRGQVATSNPFVTINSNIPYSTTALPHGQSQRVFVADIDGDGKTDVVVVNPTGQCGPADGIGPQDGVFVYLNGIAGALAAGSSATFVPLNSGAPLFCLPRTTASTSSGFVYAEATIDHISDFDGNGLPDFFLVNSSTGGASVGSNDFAGVAMTQLSNSGTVSAPISSCTAIGLVSDTTPGNFNDECHWSSGYVTHWMDINGDGLEDFVIARPGQKQWQVRMNLGSGHLAAMIAPAASGYVGLDTDAAGQFRYATKLPIMDVDGDGKMDLLVPSTTQGAAGHGFAMKMCTMHGIAPQSNTECVVPSSGTSLSDVLPTAPDAVGCPTYFCPENPGTSLLDLPPDGNPGLGKQWNHHEAVGSYTKGGAIDLSAYYLAMLKFVQTGPGTMRVDLIETPAIARLKDSIGHTDDMFGDGLQDVLSSLGCVNTQATGLYPITGQVWSFQYCNAVNDNTYGPMNLPAPAGTATSTLATQVLPYASINQGVASVGGSPGAPAAPRLPTPAIAQGAYGTQLPLTTPFLPGLMSAAQNGVGDFASWGFFPLSVPAVVNGGAFYSVACSDPSHCGYADSHNYYFASSMPAVYGMGQNNGSGGAVGFRSAYYSYSEAIYNHLGRGFQGFRTITSNSYDAGAATPRDVRAITTYKQKFPLAGKVESIVSMSPAGTVFERETDHWTCSISNRAACPQDSTVTGTCFYAGPNTNVPAVNTVYSPVLDSDCIERFDLGTGTAVNHSFTFNAASQTTSASGWDANGNLLNQNVTSADDGAAFVDSQFVASHVVNTTNAYLVDTTNWWLNKLNSSSVTTSIAYVTSRPLPAVAAAPPRNVTSSYIWNTDRTLSSSTRHTGTSNQDMVTSYSYPASGSVGLPTSVTVSGSGITQPRSTQFTYSKDGATQANDGYFVLTTMNALGQVTTTKHASADGQVTTTIDPNGVSTINNYDIFGHLFRIDYLAADQSTLVPSAYVSWTPCAVFAGGSCGTGYGEGGNQIAAAWRVTRVQSGEPTAADWYDALGRRVKHVESEFSGTFVEQFTNYDEMNTIASQSTPFNFVTSGGQYALTQWTYDRLGRPLTKKAPGAELDPTHGNVQTTYSYAGGRTAIKVYASLSGASCSDTNTLCMNMTRSVDVLGRLERTVQGKGATSSYATTDYWYDPIGSVVASKDAESNISTASFDDVGHRSRLVDIDGGTWSFAFDALGEITNQTDARNVATTTLYDGLGRMIQRSSTNNPLTAQNISAIQDTWHYDPVGANGRLAYVQRFAGATTASLAQIWKESYAYEPATTRLSSITSSLQGQTDWTTSLTYDGNGREETVTYPSHLTVRDSYTPSGALSGLSNDADGTSYWSGLDADERGTITSELYFGTLSGNHETDYASGQVLNKSWANGSTPLDEWTYAYDSFANVTGQARSLYGGTTSSETYAYDGMQRLSRAARTNASGNLPTIAYGYTPSGNLDSKSDFSSSTAGSYTYGAGTCGPHAATGVSTPTGSLTYTCDANGNVTGGNTLSGNYDFNNQPWSLTRAGSGGGSAQFLYSADGQIFEQQTPSDTTWFGVHGYEVSLSGGQTVMRHELGPVVVVRQGTTDTSMAVLRDRLGSQVMLASGGTGGGGSGPPTPTISFNPPVSLDGHYAVNWTSSTGATSYTLRQQVSGGAATTVYTGAATTWSPTAANPVGTYAYSVQACAGTVCSNFSTPVAIEVEPAPPTSISAAPNPSTTGTYTVTWVASAGAQTYTLDEQVNHAGPWSVVSSANASVNWTTPIARTAGTYSYRVHACLAQCGNPSAVVNEVVSASTSAPLTPTGLTASPYPSTTGSYTVSWQAAANAT